MSEDQVRSAIDGIRARLQDELDAQLRALGQTQADAVAAARRAAEAEAEQQWAAKAEALRAEWSGRLESEVAAARSEAEQRLTAESTRLRAEAEQAVAAERQRAQAQAQAERQQIEQERGRIAAERQAVEAERRQLEAERQRLQQETVAEREKIDRAREAQAAKASAAALAAERHAQLAAFERVLGAVRSMDSARSLSDALTALVKAAAAEAPRAALFIVNGSDLQGWKAEGFTGGGPLGRTVPASDTGLLGGVLRSGETLTASDDTGRRAPDFAALPPDRAAIAVPIAVGGITVAVLYADDAASGAHQAPAAWPETVQILGRHASACVAHLTAVRTAQASRLIDAGAVRTTGATGDGTSDDDNGARRYARLLVSEIKLYNEGAVRAGREKRDLLHRLREEIERARRLYEERIPPAVAARHAYFQQELVQTLAGGDPACLGGSA